ncbi:MAG: glycoside hydrolase family 2 [Clostridia bacterium]|nr:glycoside hydrolase family 2 [Clostridia bacterium]
MKKIKDHPRPQFVRDSWQNLNGKWNFIFDDENAGEQKEFFKKFPKATEITVPFTYETKMSGIDDQTVHENIWYNNKIHLKSDNDKRTILHFEGSDFITKLWVNGSYAGMHTGGYHRFSFDISGYIVDGENDITIKVEDSLSINQPRGKQRYKSESFSCWYVQTTGIWKTVWIETVPENYIVSVKNTPDLDKKIISIELYTNINETALEDYEIETEIRFENELINIEKAKAEKRMFKYEMNICGPQNDHAVKAWSPEHPYLYDITYRLYKDNVLLDEVSSYFGVRKISVNGSKILLNDKELYLKMVLDQGYWADSHLTPPDEDAMKKDIAIAKKFGYNGIRKHQKTEDERFLYYCDINGLLVWGEMPSCYAFNDTSVAYFTDEWIKIVKQNYCHPSIIAWVPMNESWGIFEVAENVREQSFLNSLYYLTKSLDKTRPVISNDGWEHTISDIVTIHDYKQEPDLLYSEYNDKELAVLNNKKAFAITHKLFSGDYKYKGQPVIISEYGGIKLRSDNGWGYGNQVRDEKEFFERFAALNNAIRKTEYISGFCYTQLTDVQQEQNGLVDENRNDKFSDEVISKICYINSK